MIFVLADFKDLISNEIQEIIEAQDAAELPDFSKTKAAEHK